MRGYITKSRIAAWFCFDATDTFLYERLHRIVGIQVLVVFSVSFLVGNNLAEGLTVLSVSFL